MKKLLILIGLLFLVACSNEDKVLIHEDFRKDIGQILEILELAREENRNLNSDEYDLYRQFDKKYIYGKFVDSNGKEYEMNNLEKQIVRNIELMQIFTDEKVGLASEEGIYEKNKRELEEYLNAKLIPEDIESYPTYEKHEGIHPQYKSEATNLIRIFDPLVNGTAIDVYPDDLQRLNNFISKYEGEGFEADDVHYLLTGDEISVYLAFMELKEDIDTGKLLGSTIENFNDAKDLLE